MELAEALCRLANETLSTLNKRPTAQVIRQSHVHAMNAAAQATIQSHVYAMNSPHSG
ncbi:hypothetical protein ACQV2E_11630 [Pantoea allii]|uniref:hypothetical protein n=1 Tax=Pantoea allii TaxID=574096 RepID=UPI003D31D974